MTACWVQVCRTPLEVRAAEHKRNWKYAQPQNLSLSVDICQKHIERAYPLIEPAYDLIPLVTGEYLRQQIAEPGIAMIAVWNFKRDPQLPESRFQPLFKLSQIGTTGALQLLHELHVRRPWFGAWLAQHFVPSLRSAIPFGLCHADLHSVNWNRVVAQGPR